MTLTPVRDRVSAEKVSSHLQPLFYQPTSSTDTQNIDIVKLRTAHLGNSCKVKFWQRSQSD
ncbi:hypothetical protein H6F74_03970 [Trichocoleus sp. FACHB-90]|uniref:hypothetical protein n=1 Tax=Cyanophyceae TaxID=3028117 RepID=UPI001689F9EC|nr:hypothetical protein [Trichocoleus sp. FACHB-90]MBD1925445.1 hypothetical protein [Trichocoleus sp. FACHB-90]